MSTESPKYGPELSRLRSQRMYMWWVVLLYLPIEWLTLKITRSDKAMFLVFIVWVVFLADAVQRVVIFKCPRCGNYFHIRGMITPYLRRCRHCDLHIDADKNHE